MQDFYTGFEGEPEIRFVLTRNQMEDRTLRLWEGYFNAIMMNATPEDGRWTGLALPYHLHEGWYEKSPWMIEELPSALEQWEKIDKASLSPECLAVHASVIELMTMALETGGDLWICYD